MSLKHNYFIKSLFIILAYLLGGELGSLFTAPPDFTPVIWPPAGIGMALLLIFNQKHLPAVALGAFVMQFAPMGNFIAADTASIFAHIILSLGATLQAYIGYKIICRLFGADLQFNGIKDIFLFITLGGTIPALAGAAAYAYVGDISNIFSIDFKGAFIMHLIGILIFSPLTLFMSGQSRLSWKKRVVKPLPLLLLITLLFPLGLTLYSWKIAAVSAYQRSYTEFEAMVK